MASQAQKDALAEAYRRVQSGNHSYSEAQVDAINKLADRWGVKNLLESRQQMSKAEFEHNQPQPTKSSIAREALLGVSDAFGITSPSIPETIKNVAKGAAGLVAGVGKAAFSGPQAQWDLAKGVGTGLVAPVKEAAEGWQENDPEKFAHGAAGTLALTYPAARGAVTGVRAGYAAIPEGTFQRTPPNLLKRVFGPNVELEHLQRAGSDLKAAEAATGKKIVDVPSALSAEEHQAGALNDRVGAILTPQENVIVPGSRAKYIEAQKAAIPDDIRIHDPAKYQSLVADLDAEAGLPDMTIGEINKARVSANKLQRNYYKQKFGAQLTRDEQLHSAMLGARDAASHQLLSEALDTVGLGGATEVKNLTQRLGSLIKVKEGLQGQAGAAELQAGTPTITRFGQQARSLVDKARLKGLDKSLSINEDLADAMRRWKDQPADFQMIGSGAPKGQAPTGGSPAFVRPPKVPSPQPTLPGAPATLAGAQNDLMPSGGAGTLAAPETAPKPYAEGMAPIDEVPRRKLWAGASADDVQPTVTGGVPAQPGADVAPTPTGKVPRFGQPTPYAAEDAKPATVEGATPGTFQQPPGQTDLQKGIPPELFGVDAPQGPTPPQQQLRFGNGPSVEQTSPPVEGQQNFSFPKTDREMFLEEYFKQHPETAPRARRY